jgi:hypothetical protein
VRRYCAPSQVERCSRMGAAISGRPLCYPQVTRPSRQTRRSLCDQGIRHVYAEKSSESDCMFALRQPLRHVAPQPIGRRIIGTYRSASAFRKEEAKLRGLRGSRLAFSLASRCSLPASVGHLVVAHFPAPYSGSDLLRRVVRPARGRPGHSTRSRDQGESKRHLVKTPLGLSAPCGYVRPWT